MGKIVEEVPDRLVARGGSHSLASAGPCSEEALGNLSTIRRRERRIADRSSQRIQDSLVDNERVPEESGDAIAPQELLYRLLTHSLAFVEAKDLARRLLERFGSIGNILAARHERLREVCDDRIIALLHNVHLLMKAALREPVTTAPVLNDLKTLYDYLRICLAYEANEVVRLLFLNNKNVLLKDELHSSGTINHTPVYPREIVRRAIELNANALIIVHNHPSGDPSPSGDDIGMTQLLARVLKDIGIQLHDHIIVGQQRCESLRSLGYM